MWKRILGVVIRFNIYIFLKDRCNDKYAHFNLKFCLIKRNMILFPYLMLLSCFVLIVPNK
jgi:hypothetical protein